MSRKQLGAAQGIEAACILFQLNSKTADILRLAENAGLPSVFIHGLERTRLCAEWRAFVHAAVTAGLMQHAPNSVLVGYLRQTGHLLRAAEADAPDGRVQRPHRPRPTLWTVLLPPTWHCWGTANRPVARPSSADAWPTPHLNLPRNWRKTCASRRVWPL